MGSQHRRAEERHLHSVPAGDEVIYKTIVELMHLNPDGSRNMRISFMREEIPLVRSVMGTIISAGKRASIVMRDDEGEEIIVMDAMTPETAKDFLLQLSQWEKDNQ